MSYILEALKKAQAERQLGSAPTIHALPVHPVAAPVAARRAPVWILLAAGVLFAGAAALFAWRKEPAPAPVVLVQAPPVLPAPVVKPAPPPPPLPAPVRAATAPKPKPPPEKPRDDPAPEESLPTLQALSPSVQSQIPQIAFGGYMYSKNPADRLLLIDKVLRREGEEVAPGLVLEKLLPRAAVLNYRGTRYRVTF